MTNAVLSNTTGLLVSVRSVEEAAAALQGGADWIDVKEPANGALGCAKEEVISMIANHVAAQRPVSAALGELCELDLNVAKRIASIEGLQLVKVGLAGAVLLSNWKETWQAVCNELARSATVCCVVYADWEKANSPSPQEVLQAMPDSCEVVLIDTFDKSGPGLGELFSPDAVAEFVKQVKQLSRSVVLAGRVGIELLPALLEVKPDLIGVRGAVCEGSRESAVDVSLIESFKLAMLKAYDLLEQQHADLQ